MKARVIAYYLPQYHPIPENDKYWGKGFTEWTNVTKAKPLFRGHYQPKLPSDLGFYDLRLPIVREEQAELARNSGIEGFMYWHYWFGNGKMVLEKPFEEVLSSGKPDFPFCLGWANHSWTNKSWSKGSSFQKDNMIFEQTYPGEDDHISHFKYCLSAFRDQRYIKFEGKPIFVIWDPSAIPNVKSFISLWRKMAVDNGLEGVHFVAIRYGNVATVDDLLNMGFDAVNNSNQYEAENRALGGLIFLKKIRALLTRITNGGVLRKYQYKNVIKNLGSALDMKDNVYPTIISGYDRSARAGRKATIYHNYTPEYFDVHVKNIIDEVEHKPAENKIIFLKSWNEWAEGNYVEPDLKYGHAFLDVLKKNILSK